MSTPYLEQWVSRLSHEEIPSFANTARRMAAISNNAESSANDLAKVILQDTTMTTRVLRLASSVYYNPSGRKLDTVSYAIVVLGFEKVRNLALSVSMLESFLNSNLLSHVKKEMACAYHAAIQAQRLAEKLGIKETENIYIAALLHRLGQLMFWCFPYEYGNQLEAAAKSSNAYEKTEKEILGFNLKELTDSLIKEWNLSPLLHDTLTYKSFKDQKKSCILLGFSIADCAKDSWQSAEANRHIRAISAFLNCTIVEARQWLYDSAKKADEGLQCFQLDNKSQRFIAPIPKNTDEGAKASNVIGIFNRTPIDSEPLHERQSRLLRQITHLLNEELNLSHFLLAMLEGINGAIQCDQSFVILYKGKERELVLKQHIGDKSKLIAKNTIQNLETKAAPLARLLTHKAPSWSANNIALSSLGGFQFAPSNVMVSPIAALGKTLGFVFSVRTESQEITPQDFQCFSHFCEHANIAFRMFISDKK
ncbi:MAG: HD-like signal output (HDOD) protein [Lentisphaeria bacterium]|jgi:HD-like signal output (HDOD) protein